MDYAIADKKALVLGASGGLGAACALALAGEGVSVKAAARRPERLQSVLSGMNPALTGSISPITVDLADKQSVDRLIAEVLADGGVDILINNGGGPPAGPTRGQTPATWDAAFQSMAVALFRITNALLSTMIEKSWGRVITIGSSGIEQPIPNLVLSNAVRASVAGWSKTLAAEVAPCGVTVNMVLPGRIDTDRVRSLDEAAAVRTGASVDQVQAGSRKDIPVGRYGRPEEFAAAVAFLASRQASYITGSMLRVDGGFIRAL